LGIKPKLPNKPISKASVYFAGERNAGISSTYFNLDVWIDLGCFVDKDQALDLIYLNDVRQSIADTYELMMGEKPTWVLFDFESDGYKT
jgi:hypothetical protein